LANVSDLYCHELLMTLSSLLLQHVHNRSKSSLLRAVYTMTHVRRTCTTPHMCDDCLHYRTCTSCMCGVEDVCYNAHVRRTCMGVVSLDHSILQSDVTGCVIQLLSGVQKFNAQVTAKCKCLSTTQYLHNDKVSGLHFHTINVTELINLQTNKLS